MTKLGAEKWVDFRETKDLVKDIVAATDGLGAHAAVVTAATGEAYAQAVDYLRMGGTLMVVGLPARASLSADIFFTVVKSISILGSYVGNRQDAREALDIAARGKVKCHYVLKPLSALAEYVAACPCLMRVYLIADARSLLQDVRGPREGRGRRPCRPRLQGLDTHL